jgi:hypothetical protein
MQGAYAPNGGGENAELRSYVMSRLLWDVNADANAAIDEFHEGYYGKAAKPMRAYFDLLHNQVRGGQHIWIFVVPSYSPAFLREAAGLFRQAEQAAAGDEALLGRIRKARLSLDYVEYLKARQFEVRGESYEPASMSVLRERFAGLMKTVRSFGITSIHEGRQLEWDEKEFELRMKPYRVETLQNSALRVDIAPDLAGRVIRIVEKGSGADLLRPLDTGERFYPNLGGLAAFVYPDFHGTGLDIEWKWDGDGVLRGKTEKGLELRRELRVDGAKVRAATTVTNRGTEPMEVALQDRGDFNASDLRIKPGELSAATDPCAVSGEWRVTSRVVARANPAEMDRCAIAWSAKGPGRVTLTLWSKKRNLQPGESLALGAEYESTASSRWSRGE